VESLEYAGSADTLRNLSFEIIPVLDKEAKIFPNCRMEIISLASIPDVHFLSLLAEQLKQNTAGLNPLVESLEPVSSPATQWTALAKAPGIIDGLIATLDVQKMVIDEEIAKLRAAVGESLSAHERSQQRALEDQLFQMDSEISDLAHLSSDILSALKDGASCGDGSSDGFCVDAIEGLTKSIKEKVLLQRSDAESFQVFIESEIDRLSLLFPEEAEKLKTLIRK